MRSAMVMRSTQTSEPSRRGFHPMCQAHKAVRVPLGQLLPVAIESPRGSTEVLEWSRCRPFFVQTRYERETEVSFVQKHTPYRSDIPGQVPGIVGWHVEHAGPQEKSPPHYPSASGPATRYSVDWHCVVWGERSSTSIASTSWWLQLSPVGACGSARSVGCTHPAYGATIL